MFRPRRSGEIEKALTAGGLARVSARGSRPRQPCVKPSNMPYMNELPKFPTKLTFEFIGEVAEVYLRNFNGAPTKAVAEHFGVKPTMASNYVKAAELAGLLPPTTPGKRRGQ